MFVWEHERKQGKRVHASRRLFEICKIDRPYRLNLKNGLYSVWKGNHATHCHVQSTDNKDSSGNQRSYFMTCPNVHEGMDSSDCGQYIWDASLLSSSTLPIKVARELLPFEKIELMFEMVRFLKIYERTAWQLRPEDGRWSDKKFDYCANQWHEIVKTHPFLIREF